MNFVVKMQQHLHFTYADVGCNNKRELRMGKKRIECAYVKSDITVGAGAFTIMGVLHERLPSNLPRRYTPCHVIQQNLMSKRTDKYS